MIQIQKVYQDEDSEAGEIKGPRGEAVSMILPSNSVKMIHHDLSYPRPVSHSTLREASLCIRQQLTQRSTIGQGAANKRCITQADNMPFLLPKAQESARNRARRDCKMVNDYTKAGSFEHTRKATCVNSENVTAHTKAKQIQII